MPSFSAVRSALGRSFAGLRLSVCARILGRRTAYAAGVLPLDASPPSRPWFGDLQAHQPEDRTGARFRVLTLVTVLSIFGLVTLGGVVRLTESGLGCPDWPLCHGRIIPPLDGPTLIEYSHRLMASVVGVLVLATAVVAWRSYRLQPWLFIPATLAFFILVVQVLLGGFTVLAELSGGIVLAHLATAEALLACTVVVCIVALRGAPVRNFRDDPDRGRDWFPILALGASLATYGLLLTGSYVTVSGSTVACGQTWPHCQGQLFPDGQFALLHMLHRGLALIVGALIVAVLAHAWRRRSGPPYMRRMAAGMSGFFLVQVAVGAAIVLLGFPVAARVLHLSMASLVWMALVALAVVSYLYYTTPDRGPRGVSHA